MKHSASALTVAAGVVGMIIGSYFAVAQQPPPPPPEVPIPVPVEAPIPVPVQETNETAKEFAQDQILEVQSRLLMIKYRAATSPEDRDRLMSDMGKIVAQQFDVRQQMRQKELQRLEDQLKRLRQVHQQRTEQKDRIVKDHLQQLVHEADGLGWGDSPSGGWPSADESGQSDQEAALRDSQREFDNSIREYVQQQMSKVQQQMSKVQLDMTPAPAPHPSP